MTAEKKWKKCLDLFWSMFLLSSGTFGGGFVIISMMRQQFVEKKGWLKEEEMLDMTAIAQCTPGSLAVNAAIAVGYRLAGTAGAVFAAFGAVLPPLLIISVISIFYQWFSENRYIAIVLQVMRAGVAAVIFDVVISLAGNVCKTKNALWIIMMALAFTASYFFGVSAVLMIIVCAVVGLLYGFLGKGEKA